MLKKILSFIIFILVVFTVYLIFNTLTFKSKQINYKAVKKIALNDSSIYRLAQAVGIKTISPEHPAEFDSAGFEAFKTFLEETYAGVERHLEKTVVNSYSFLYKWQGKDSRLKPVVLVAHLDVPPVPPEDADARSSRPFSGEIKDGLLWGRGTLNNKTSVIGILEAANHLIQRGFEPSRSVFLAFGHDKEVGGDNGAKSIAKLLKANGIRPEFVLGEGPAITQGLVPGVLTDVALIGIAEKGSATLTLSVDPDEGHSNNERAADVLTRAITLLEDHPFPVKITEPVRQFLEHAGPEMRFQDKLLFANNRLLRLLAPGIYLQAGPGKAFVQTTMDPTVCGGIRENTPSASATINFRMLPGVRVETVVEQVKKAIDDDRINIDVHKLRSDPGNVSSTNSTGYAIIDKTIREIFPETITVPNLVLAATDGRHYGETCEDVYRFLPVRLNPDNIDAIRGVDERIPVNEFEDAVRFYVRLIENCQ
ncbi:MAG: M20/M25/M40 family metallo-hydrolase [Cytophagales bacterium]|nr:M20/M25/M40 family metallo-hydrolase [Cytophagales bacterium]